MTFKDCIAADVHGVFLNPDEFSERRTIIYDGETYEDTPVSVQEFEENDRPRVTAPGSGRSGTDSASGLYLATHILYAAHSDFGGGIPEQGKHLKIKSQDSDYFREYDIVSSGCEMGMLRIELRAVR